ncbi:Helix-turn-helix domain protein [uncultured Sporomusa sp.]|uniref:Helix-turn-helix domain protein n=1 Tax=uncultured Sporomusa sp. TaxID=307249 RepID=A0A212LV29_9FIRM|nr:helix-turn-helix transcriptional regulator [uncultured Sporomusa sp.]SCM81393.1 Helix-turn-helix domain protein [uncultured Sporomusa sp.]
MKPDYVVIGLRLKEARNQVKITQQELAAFAGVSVSYVKNTERGGKPSLEYLLSVAEKCNKTIDWLLNRVHSDNKSQTQEVEAIFDPDLKQMVDVLKKLMESDNQHLRGWTIIQFQNAFKEHYTATDD